MRTAGTEGKNSRQRNSICKELVSGRNKASCRQGEGDEWSIALSDWREIFAVRSAFKGFK